MGKADFHSELVDKLPIVFVVLIAAGQIIHTKKLIHQRKNYSGFHLYNDHNSHNKRYTDSLCFI